MMLKRLTQAIRKRSSLGAEFAWVIAAQLFMVFGGLATIKLLSNVLSKQEFGIYALLFSTVSIIVSVLYMPIGQINMRFLVLAQQQGFVERFKLDTRKLLLAVSAFSVLILAPGTYFMTPYPGFEPLVFMALAFLVVIIGMQTSQQYLLMGFRLRREGSTAQMIGAIARPTAVFLALVIFGYNALSASFGLALGFMILTLSQLYYLNSPWKEAIRKDNSTKEQTPQTRPPSWTGDYFPYGAFFVLVGMVAAIVLNADRWILLIWGNINQVAIYAALMQVSTAPVAFGHAILTRMAAPIFFSTKDKPKQEQKAQFRVLLSIWVLMCAVILLVTWQFHFRIVQLLTNTSYAEYSYILPWMVLGLLLERSSQILELKGSMMLNTRIYIYPRLLLILLVPVLEYMFLSYFGFDWLVLGLVCATTIGLLSIVFVNRLKLRGL